MTVVSPVGLAKMRGASVISPTPSRCTELHKNTLTRTDIVHNKIVEAMPGTTNHDARS